jgi:transcriptional regulator with XRE-family HTH domain
LTLVLTDDIVIAMRRRLRKVGKINQAQYAKQYGVSVWAISEACRGITFKHLNNQEPPVRQMKTLQEEGMKARELFRQGLTYNQIVEKLTISKSSVSKYCCDLAQEKLGNEKKLRQEKKNAELEEKRQRREKLASQKKEKIPVPKRKLVNASQILTDDQVIALRESVRNDGFKGLKHYADQLKVSKPCISQALKGFTFSHLNEISVPFSENFVKPCTWRTKDKVDPAIIQQALDLRLADPVQWHYGALAVWLREQTGRLYRPGPVAVILRNHDPSLVEFDQGVTSPKRVQPYKPMSTRKPRSDEQRREQIRRLHQKKANAEKSALLVEAPDELDESDPSLMAFLAELEEAGRV